MLAQLLLKHVPSIPQIVHQWENLLHNHHLTLKGSESHPILVAGGLSAAQLHTLVACPSLQALQAWSSPSRSSQLAEKS